MQTYFTLNSQAQLINQPLSHPDGICTLSHLPDKYGTKPFLKWILAQGLSPYAPDISENASDLGIPLKGVPQALGDKPNPSKEGKSLGGWPSEARGITLLIPQVLWRWPSNKGTHVGTLEVVAADLHTGDSGYMIAPH